MGRRLEFRAVVPDRISLNTPQCSFMQHWRRNGGAGNICREPSFCHNNYVWTVSHQDSLNQWFCLLCFSLPHYFIPESLPNVLETCQAMPESFLLTRLSSPISVSHSYVQPTRSFSCNQVTFSRLRYSTAPISYQAFLLRNHN